MHKSVFAHRGVVRCMARLVGAHMRYLKILVLTVSVATLATTAFADGHDTQPTESPYNLSFIDATTYFESLGWSYIDKDWTGPVTWDPMGTGPLVGLTVAERDTALGAGAAVAVLDGRANDTHSDLPFNASLDADPATDSVVFEFTGFPVGPSYTAYDLHGTHTSGIVGARLNGVGTSGVAPMARLLNYAVFDDNGWIGIDEDYVLSHAVSYGASVANMSYGPTTAGDFASGTSLTAINNHKSDIVVVKSSGNDGVNILSEFYRSKDSNPLSNLIIAGSVEMTVDASGNLVPTIAWYSNTPGNACVANRTGCVVSMMDIFMVAPGGNANIVDGSIEVDVNGYVGGIWSTDELGGYYRISGTSMAAPHIAGAVALLHSQWPILKWDPEVTRQILFDTATDLGAAGVDPVYGQGLLNVARAMRPIGAPTFGITVGGGGDDSKGGGKGGGNSGKSTHDLKMSTDVQDPIVRDSLASAKQKSSTWALADTAMLVRHGFAALTETKATVSVFDKYRRDFSVALSSLTGEGRSELSGRLEQMVTSNFASSGYFVPGRDDLYLAVTQDFRYLGNEGRRNLTGDIRAAGVDSFDLRAFAGFGNAQPLFYSPGAIVGGMASAGGATSGINPFLGFASGDKFAGASADKLGPFRLALGYAENEGREPLYDTYKAGAAAASVSFSLNEAQKINVAMTDLRERGGVFGSRSQGALTMGKETRTRAVSLSWDHADLYGLELAASWTLGLSEGQGNGLLTLDKETLSDAFHVGIAKSGFLTDRDRAVFSISQPLRVFSGSLHLYADKAWDADGVMQMQSETISLAPSGRELDLQVEYSYRTAGAGEVSTFAYYAVDAGHIAGREESGFGIKYQLKF